MAVVRPESAEGADGKGQVRGGRKTRRGSGEGGDAQDWGVTPAAIAGAGAVRLKGRVAGIPPQHGRWQCRQPPGQHGSLRDSPPRGGALPCSPGRASPPDHPKASRPSSDGLAHDAQHAVPSRGAERAWARADMGRCAARTPMVTAHAASLVSKPCAFDASRCLTAAGTPRPVMSPARRSCHNLSTHGRPVCSARPVAGLPPDRPLGASPALPHAVDGHADLEVVRVPQRMEQF